MSHTYTAAIPALTDLPLLRRAFQTLGWTVRENCKARTWGLNPDREKVYPLVAVSPLADGYDVGIVLTDEPKKIELQADLFSPGGIVKQLGKDYGRLRQHYNLAHVQQVALHKGYKLTVKEKDGDLHVEVTQ